MSERMIFGGAVMTSALVSGSAQIVVRAVRARGHAAIAAAPPAAGAPPVMATVARDLLLELGRDLLGVRVTAGSAPACRRRSRAAYRGARPAP